MPNEDVSPDLSRLEKDYKILTELHREDGSRTFLARHLGLDRDVTITVSRAPGDDDKALVHFAADARLLASIRHPNLIPVIEGVWLDEHTLAVVRERTDGSTLDQLISSVGPVPVARVAATIEQVQMALDRVRSDGVVHRNVSPRSVVFEQGNGRVLVSLEPRPLSGDAKPDESDDARTLGRLASDMLSGKIGGNDEASSEAKTSPQIAPEIAEALEAVETCNRSSASSAVAALLTTLKPAAESTDGEQAAGAAKEPSAEPAIAPPSRLPARPRRRVREKAVVASSFGFNARLGTAVAIAAIIAAAGLFLFRQRNARDPRLALAASDTQQAAGEVAPSKRRPDSAAPRGSSPPITASQPPAPPTVTPPETLRTPQKPETTSTVTPPQTSDTTSAGVPRPRIMPPDTPRHEPPKTAPPLTFPMPHDSTSKPPPDSVAPAQKLPPDSVAPAQKPPPDSVASAPDTNACASQAAEDQQKCLTEAIDRSDRAVNTVLAKLISALRRQAGAAAADPDPPTVDQLRAAQRTWADDRDAACRDTGEQPLYARGRSACFAAQSANRARELQRMLDTIPPTS
jgi:serine/threonine protein kinase